MKLVQGLRSTSKLNPEVISILVTLNHLVNVSDTVYNAASISSVLNGMRNLNDNTTEVRNVLKIMSPRIRASPDVFTPKELSNSISGLMSMSSNSKSLLNVLLALTEKISECKEPFTSLDIGLCFSGLKNMRTSPEVNKFLGQMALKLEKPFKMRERDISTALYGLQGFLLLLDWHKKSLVVQRRHFQCLGVS